jgi:hypothetical protein
LFAKIWQTCLKLLFLKNCRNQNQIFQFKNLQNSPAKSLILAHVFFFRGRPTFRTVAEKKIGKICKFLQKFREHKIEGKKKGRKKLHPSPVCVREGMRAFMQQGASVQGRQSYSARLRKF